MDTVRSITMAAVALGSLTVAVLLIDPGRPPSRLVVPQREDTAVPTITRSTTTAAPTGLGAIIPDTVAPQAVTQTRASSSTPSGTTTLPPPATSLVTRQPAPPPSSGPAPVPVPPPVPPPPPPPPPPHSPTVSCPSPVQAIGTVPSGARAEVAANLAELDRQIAEANRQLRALGPLPDPQFIQNTILGPLTARRIATLDRIAIAIGRYGPRPQGLQRFASCDVV
ncbi:hypothetical protein [Actinocrispum sp. NPDC049592]|uniref:hypothetical protein n=1 Tax=Actinocrispum sp. NPDC049592 TaxID=3154835 RepID=UPI0034220D13